MGKSGKRTGYRPRTQKQQARDAALAAAAAAAKEKHHQYTRYLLIACAVLLAVAIAFGVASLARGCAGTPALSTPHYRVDGDMLTYYFYEYYLSELDARGEDYTAAGLDPEAPLDEQMYDGSTTWEAHFLSEVKVALRRMLVFAETAYREGVADAAAAREAADACILNLRAEAAELGKPFADYLQSRYGVEEAVVRRAEELAALAEARYRTFAAEIYTAEKRLEKYEQNPHAYRMADVISYAVSVDLAGISGEEAMRAEFLRAETRAKRIAAAVGEEAFLAAMEADMREENPSLSDREVKAALQKAYVYHIPAAAQGHAGTWVNEAGRKAGDTAVLGETGYYTVVYCVAAPRLVEGYRADAQYIFVPYTDHLTEAQAKKTADGILAEFLDGAKSSASFSVLAERHSKAAEHLFSAVTYGDVDRPLANWLTDSARKAGDTAVIAGFEGYYVLHYTARAPLPLWEELVADALREDDYRRYLSESGVTVYESACVVPSLAPGA